MTSTLGLKANVLRADQRFLRFVICRVRIPGHEIKWAGACPKWKHLCMSFGSSGLVGFGAPNILGLEGFRFLSFASSAR